MTHLSERSALPTTLFHLARTSAAWLSYRHRLRTRLMRALPPPLLRVLTDLPLPITDTLQAAEHPGATIHWLRSNDIGALCERSRLPLVLVGPPGSGRSLVLAQIAWRWVQASTSIPTLWLNLAQDDTADRSPHAVISAMLRDAGEMHVNDTSIETHRPWLLLVAEWEELPHQRQCEWLEFLHDLPRTWPDAQLCIALPDELTRQSSFPRSMPLALRAPDDELVKRMLDSFLPRNKRDALMTKLASENELASLRERAVELILLAWMYEEGNTPTCRDALWSWAIERWANSEIAANSWLRDHQITRRYLAARRQEPNVEPIAQAELIQPIETSATVLTSAPPEPAAIANLRQLSAALLVEDTTPDAQRATLDAIGTSTAPGVGMVLVRCALMPELPAWLRLYAVNLLAARRGAATLLSRILEAPAAPDLLRAHVIEALAAQPANSAVSGLVVSALQNSTFPLTQRAAARALGSGEQNPAAIHALITLLDKQADAFDLLEACIGALGYQHGTNAVPQIARWLGNSARERLHSDWNDVREVLSAPLSESWPQATLSTERRHQIATFFARCAVAADEPTTLNELLNQCAERLSAAAARTLAQIGDDSALEALCNALQSAPEDFLPALLQAIVALDPSGERLITLIGQPVLQGRARWLTIQALPAAAFPVSFEQLLLSIKDDPFARGALTLALANCPAQTGIPLLLRLIEEPLEQVYVREQALSALGAVRGAQVEALLLEMIADSSLPVALRAAAAQALPTPVSAEGCAMLRELLQDYTLHASLLVGILAALGETRDSASLSWALHLCKHDSPDVALAAMQTVQRIGDLVALPLLKGIAQSIKTTPPLRMQAAGAMLQLDSEEGLSLLAPVFEGGILPLQLQALDLLANAQPDSPLIAAVLRDRKQALPLRQRAAQAIVASNQPMLCSLLADSDEQPTLRLMLIDLLFASMCSMDDTERSETRNSMSTILLLAYESSLAHNLRWRVLRTLAAFGRQAEPIFSDLIQETHGDPTVRRWAAEYLQHITSNLATGDAS